MLPSYYDLVYINEYNLKKPVWYDQLLMLNKNKNLKSIIDLSTIFKDEIYMVGSEKLAPKNFRLQDLAERKDKHIFFGRNFCITTGVCGNCLL